jgi:tight adherence protein C
MTPILVGLLAGLAVTLVVVGLFDLATTPSRAVSQEVKELQSRSPSPFGSVSRRRRQSSKQKLQEAVGKLGEQMIRRGGRDLVVTVGLILTGLIGGAILDLRLAVMMLLALWLGGLGWLAPSWYVSQRRRKRRTEISRALADALDLLVACVEAGISLNQALVRVADEIRNISEALSAELVMVNLEIRAGTARDDALRNFAERTGVEDIENLVSTLIQTERFGTSVGRALRVQADTLRQKRRQRAEEAAAKTTIKLVFPLVLFVFPALFVVILGPAVIQVVQALADLR